jgi:hypothetical protein
MTPADRKAPDARLGGPTLADIERIEAIGIQAGRVVVARLRLADGRCAHWHFALGLPPGQDQRLRVIIPGE